MKYILLLFLLIPAMLFAQEYNKFEDSKYLAGAVPVVDGKIIFNRTINAPGLSQEQIYDMALNWAKQRFTINEEQKGRVVYTNEEKGEIACSGEEYLVFSKGALSIDRAGVTYRLIIVCTPGKCEASLNAIRYTYNTGDSRQPEKLLAETEITDEYTLTKNKDKLLRKPGKFRIATIDLADDLFAGLQSAILPTKTITVPVNQTTAATPQPHPSQAVANITPATSAVTSATPSLAGFKQISAEQIPGNIIKMLSNDWMLITAGDDSKFNMMTASWGGLGYLYNKPVTFCFINPTRYTYQLMETNDTYTLSFYTETYRDALKYCGSHSGKDDNKVQGTGLTPITTPSDSKAFSEAWMIIECRKMVAQSITPEAIYSPELKEQWSGKQLHKMYIGEILNIWVK